MHWETKQFVRLTYVLYCGALEPSLQYLLGLPVYTPGAGAGARNTAEMARTKCWLHFDLLSGRRGNSGRHGPRKMQKG